MTSSQYPEAAFLSGMTASATHEVRNVLAIIKESAGLIGDIIELCSTGRALDEEKVHKAVGRVDAQVKRGADILTGLNRLSHSLDHGPARLQLRHELEQIVFMSSRIAGKQRHVLTVVDGGANPGLLAHPLHLQMALFAVIGLCIEGYPEGTYISAGVGDTAERAEVEFTGKDGAGSEVPIDQGFDGWGSAESLVDSVGGTLEILRGGHELRVSFSTE